MIELVIGDHTPAEHPDLDAGAKGLVPRDFGTHPVGCYAAAPPFGTSIPLIPRAEWPERIRDMAATNSRLSDIRAAGAFGSRIPSLNQNSGRNDGRWGYCWAHSSTHGVMMMRAVMGLPYVPLSAFSIAATIKKGQNQGGWGAQSLDFIAERGVASQAVWPQLDVDYRRHDTPEVWADAARHKVTEGWADLDTPQYDRTLTFDQVMTLLLSRTPVVGDFNWWGHSILLLDPLDGTARRSEVRVESGKLASWTEFEAIWGVNTATGGFAVNIWNSWSDSWGNHGEGVLTGDRAIPDSAVAPRAVLASAA